MVNIILLSSYDDGANGDVDDEDDDDEYDDDAR